MKLILITVLLIHKRQRSEYVVMIVIIFCLFLDTVPLGTIRELPAESCYEITASEGNEVVKTKYWIYSDGNSGVIEAHCEGKISLIPLPS